MTSSADPTENKTYHLTRNFAAGALVVVVVAAAGLAFANRQMSHSQLERMAQDNNAALTQAFANTLWPEFREFIESAQTLSADDIRRHWQIVALRDSVRALMADTDVLKVKLYDRHGLTVFSTDPKQIGGDYSENSRYLAAQAGHIASELDFRATFATFDGPQTDRWVLSSYVPVRPFGSGGSIEGVAEIYTDVTDIYGYVRRTELLLMGMIGVTFLFVFVLLLGVVWRAERQIARYHTDNLKLAASYARADAASRAKSLFLANMSHELRTPLNAIIGFAEVIKASTLESTGRTDYREFAGDIVMSGRHLLRVINDVLDLAKIETGNMKVSYDRVDAGEIAHGVVKLLSQEAAAARVTLSIEGNCAPFECDETKLRQMLLNLTANAVKFTPADGHVTLQLREVGANRDIEVVVRDTGIGIKAEDLPAALAPFGQVDSSLARRHSGTGLGLPLSKKFAELLGGSLRLDSTPGVGTSVTVVLPRRCETAGFASAA